MARPIDCISILERAPSKLCLGGDFRVGRTVMVRECQLGVPPENMTSGDEHKNPAQAELGRGTLESWDGRVARAHGPALDLPHSGGPESSVQFAVFVHPRLHLTEGRYGFEPSCIVPAVLPEAIGNGGNRSGVSHDHRAYAGSCGTAQGCGRSQGNHLSGLQ